jgi:hypothetical protein
MAKIVYDYEDEPVVTTTTEPAITNTKPYNNAINGVYGDVNGDGNVDTIDLLIVRKLILGIITG